MAENGQWNEQEMQAIYERNMGELFSLANQLTNDMTMAGKSGRELLDARRSQLNALIDLLQGQKRDLDWRAGEHKPTTVHGGIQMEGKLGDWF